MERFEITYKVDGLVYHRSLSGFNSLAEFIDSMYSTWEDSFTVVKLVRVSSQFRLGL